MNTKTASEQSTIQKSETDESQKGTRPNTTLIVKTVVTTIIILAVGAGLFFLGYGIAKGSLVLPLSKKTTKKESGAPSPKTSLSVTPSGAAQEVPYGDENLDTDVNYQKAMQNVTDDGGCTGESCPWMTYTDAKHGFSFQYPSTVFIESKESDESTVIFLDTELIVVPEVYGGPLTPVEITFPSEKTVTEYITAIKKNIYPDSYKEKQLPAGLFGVWFTGTAQGYLDGTYQEDVVLSGSKGVIAIGYYDNEKFPRDLFDRIVKTVKVQ